MQTTADPVVHQDGLGALGSRHYSRDILVTPEMAKLFTGSMRWARQRTLRPRWVEQLANAIREGELTFLTISFAEHADGRRELVDGQHRLHALIATGATLPATAIFYPVTSEEETARLYMKFDRPQTRTAIAGLRAAGVFEQTHLSETFLRRMSAAVWMIANDFRSGGEKGGSLIERTDAAVEWLNEMEMYYRAIERAPKNMGNALVRAPVAAVALVTLRHQADLAAGFWERTASQELLGAGDPRLTLGRFLLDKLEKDVPGGRAIYARYVSLAWNAFYEGRELRILKIADPYAALTIRGTKGRLEGRTG